MTGRPEGNNKTETCPRCGGWRASGTTTFAVDRGSSVVVVREVPGFVCTQCGDAWIQDPATAKPQSIVNGAVDKHAMVEVTRWQDVA